MLARHKEASQRRCPVCNKCIMGSPSDLIVHVDQCLMNVSYQHFCCCEVWLKVELVLLFACVET